MLFSTLPWKGPFPLASLDWALAPDKSGVYAFTEYDTPLEPNPRTPAPDHPDYERLIEDLRKRPCVLYVGRAKTLRDRMRGYRFKPYLEIVRRPMGSPPRHSADRHKGRALLHAQQFFSGPIYVWWADAANYAKTEESLILELNPVLNTVGIQLLEPD
jgi:hypothetical protein